MVIKVEKRTIADKTVNCRAFLKARVKVIEPLVSPLYAKTEVFPFSTSSTYPNFKFSPLAKAPRVSASSSTTLATKEVASISI